MGKMGENARFILQLCIVCIFLTIAFGQSGSSTGPSSSGAPKYTLNLVFSTDVRGRMLPIDATQTDCTGSPANIGPKCYGGVARRAVFIAQNKANYTNTFAIDVGNYYYGTSFSDKSVSNPQASNIARWVSLSSYDILGVGTNEFFNGPGMYAGFLQALQPNNPQVIVSNLDVSQEPLLSSLQLQKYTVLNTPGRKIGFIGAISAQLSAASSPGPNVVVAPDTAAALTSTIQALMTAHPDVNIIVLVTTLYRPEIITIANTVDHIDVIVYKSSDATDASRSLIVPPGPGKDAVLLLTVPFVGGPAGFGGTMAAFQIDFDDRGVLDVAVRGDTVLLDYTYGQDSTIWQQVQDDYLKVTALNNVVVGQLYEDLGENAVTQKNPGIWCRAVDCNLGRLVTDAMLNWCQDCDFSHTNGGGLRSNIYMSTSDHAPNVTRDDIAKVLPFGNNFVSYSILGKDFVSTVLNTAITRVNQGGFHQFSNIRWAYNPNAGTAPGGVVVFVSVYNKVTKIWNPIDPSRTYKVATLNFILGPPAGDGYNIGPLLGVNLYGPPAVDAVGAWIGSQNFLPPPTLNQLQVCGINKTYTLNDASGKGNITWPFGQCNILRTDGTINLADQCPTNPDICKNDFAYDGKAVNKSRCSACSGLGTCISGIRKCACDRPTTEGLFAGITMIEGNDCSFIREEYHISDGLIGFCYFLSVLSLLVSVGCTIFFYVYRDAKVIKRAANLFLQIACLGGFLGAVACLAIITPTTDTTCRVSQWLGNMGWVLMFGALFVKTWRIYSIFGNKRLKTIVLTDKDMLLRFAVVLGVEILIRCIEAGVSPPRKTAEALGNCASSQNLQDLIDGSANQQAPADFFYYFTCSSSYYDTIDAVNWAYKCAFTIGGCWLAYTIKDIQEDFNESKLLALVIYNMTIFAIIARVLIAFIGAKSPNITLAVEVLAINYVIICTLLGLAVPKYILIRRGSVATNQSVVSKTGPTGTPGVDRDGKGVGLEVSTVGGQRIGGQGGRSGHYDTEHTENVTMSPTGASGGKITPAALSKTFDTIRNRLRTSAADRTNELPQFLEHASRFIEQLTALKGGPGGGSGSSSTVPTSSLLQPASFQGRSAASSIAQTSASSNSSVGGGKDRPSVGRALQPAASSSTPSNPPPPPPTALSIAANAAKNLPPLSPSASSGFGSPSHARTGSAISKQQTISEDAPVLEQVQSSSRSEERGGNDTDPTAASASDAEQPSNQTGEGAADGEGEDQEPPPPISQFPFGN